MVKKQIETVVDLVRGEANKNEKAKETIEKNAEAKRREDVFGVKKGSVKSRMLNSIQNTYMWDKLFTMDTVADIINISKIYDEEFYASIDSDQQGEATEDVRSVLDFAHRIRNTVNYKTAVVLATRWSGYPPESQAKLATTFVSTDDLSRFMMLMDILSIRFKRGELN